MRHVHKPLPCPTHIREGMTYVDMRVAEALDALRFGREVKCACGRKGFIRNHGKGIRWYDPKKEQA